MYVFIKFAYKNVRIFQEMCVKRHTTALCFEVLIFSYEKNYISVCCQHKKCKFAIFFYNIFFYLALKMHIKNFICLIFFELKYVSLRVTNTQQTIVLKKRANNVCKRLRHFQFIKLYVYVNTRFKYSYKLVYYRWQSESCPPSNLPLE